MPCFSSGNTLLSRGSFWHLQAFFSAFLHVLSGLPLLFYKTQANQQQQRNLGNLDSNTVTSKGAAEKLINMCGMGDISLSPSHVQLVDLRNFISLDKKHSQFLSLASLFSYIRNLYPYNCKTVGDSYFNSISSQNIPEAMPS